MNKRWFLKTTLLTIALLAAVGLSACGGSSGSTSSAGSGTSHSQADPETPVSGDESFEAEGGEDGGSGLSAAVSALRANGGLHGDAYVNYDGTAAEMVIGSVSQEMLNQLVPGVTEEELAEAIEEGYARIWRQDTKSSPVDYCGFRGGKPMVISPGTNVQEGEELGFSFGCSGER